MLVLDRLHASRVQIQERLEDTRFSQQYKRETLSQLKLQGQKKRLFKQLKIPSSEFFFEF